MSVRWESDDDATRTLHAQLDGLHRRPQPEGGEAWDAASRQYVAALRALEAAAEALPPLPPFGQCCGASELMVTRAGVVVVNKVYGVNGEGLLTDTEYFDETDGVAKVECRVCGQLFRGVWS